MVDGESVGERKRLKIIAVLNGVAARTGGPPALVGESALELAQLGHEMRILSTDLALAPAGWFQWQRRITPDAVHPKLARSDTHLFRARFPRRLVYSPALGAALREMTPRYDVVHIHNLWAFPQFAAYRAARREGVPYVVSPHGSLDPYLRGHGRLRKRVMSTLWQNEMLSRAALIHVTTNAEARLIRDVAPGVPRVVVPCALYVDEFKPPPTGDEFRRKYLEGYSGPTIVFLGRVTYKKGLDLLIRAFAHARAALECRLVVVGPDDEGLQPRLDKLARELGVRRDVAFLGPLFGEDRLAALASADAWALSSYTENFGIAVTEAMAAGCAVVTTPAVNIAEDIAAAGAGIVAELAPEPFGNALVDVLTDRDLRERLRAEAPAFAGRYDWSVVGPQLVEMYRQAAATKVRAAAP